MSCCVAAIIHVKWRVIYLFLFFFFFSIFFLFCFFASVAYFECTIKFDNIQQFNNCNVQWNQVYTTSHLLLLTDRNHTRILRSVLNKSWKQHSTKQQLYGLLPPISQAMQVRWTRHAKHCWRSKDKLINDVFLWTPRHEYTSISWSTKTFISSVDTWCRVVNLPWAIRYGW